MFPLVYEKTYLNHVFSKFFIETVNNNNIKTIQAILMSKNVWKIVFTGPIYLWILQNFLKHVLRTGFEIYLNETLP